MTHRTLIPLLAISAGLVGCPGDGPDTGDTECDTAAADDCDCFPEADACAPANSLTGSFDYARSYTPEGDSTPSESCSSTFSVTGTEYRGDCAGCTWAFEMDPTEDSGDCTGDAIDPFISLGADGTTSFLTFWNVLSLDAGDFEDVFLVGYLYDYYGYDYFEFGHIASYVDLYGETQDDGGTLSISGNTIDWTFTATNVDSDRQFIDSDCTPDPEPAFDDLSAAATGSGTTSTLPCDGELVDVYEFTATAGTAVEISVDTVAAGTAFDTYFWVNNPTGCTVASADDSFDCAFEPLDYQCSGMEFTPAVDGVHQVVVGSFDSCVDDSETPSGQYTLVVTGASAATLAQDDAVDTVVEGSELITATGTATAEFDL